MPGLLDPTEDIISPDERRAISQQNLFSTLLQSGLQLAAAGDNLYPWQRAQMIGQAAQSLGGMPAQNQQMLGNAAQQKLVGQRYAEKKKQDDFLKSDEFKSAIASMPPEYQALARINPVGAITNWRQAQSEDNRAKMMADREDRREQLRLQIEQMKADREAQKEANQPTTAQKSVDTAFGKDYADWVAQGGYTDTQKQVAQLQEALAKLQSGEAISGPIIGTIDRMGLGSILTPTATNVRQQVEDAVQRNLRAVLGGQFTEREGRQLLERAYNPSLSEAENAKRVARLLDQIKGAAQAKKDAADYYEKNGTLRGWTGKVPTIGDFDPDAEKPNGGGGNIPTISSKQQYDTLPRGTVYIAPDGSRRTKP